MDVSADHLDQEQHVEPGQPGGQHGVELLDHLLILGRRHIEYILREVVEHYEEARPHQGLGQRMPRQRAPIQASETGPVLRRNRLGGVLHEYFRKARAARKLGQRRQVALRAPRWPFWRLPSA